MRLEEDLPKRYNFTFKCFICGNEWMVEVVGTLFGEDGAVSKNQHVSCPACGAKRGHSDSAKDHQPEVVKFEESEEFVVFGKY